VPFTSNDLATIDKAIAAGARSVRFQDREVEYASMDDLLKARTEILNELSAQTGPQPIRQVRVYTGSGW
jgi:hypothetical protein